VHGGDASGLPQPISGSQPCEPCADDDDPRRLSRSRRRSEPSESTGSERKSACVAQQFAPGRPSLL